MPPVGKKSEKSVDLPEPQPGQDAPPGTEEHLGNYPLPYAGADAAQDRESGDD